MATEKKRWKYTLTLHKPNGLSSKRIAAGTASKPMTKREIISALSSKHSIPAKFVYDGRIGLYTIYKARTHNHYYILIFER